MFKLLVLLSLLSLLQRRLTRGQDKRLRATQEKLSRQEMVLDAREVEVRKKEPAMAVVYHILGECAKRGRPSMDLYHMQHQEFARGFIPYWAFRYT